ncbi:MAG: HAD-IC family P-type ATPase [Patescibacteria group bacterium]|nr:HAD-IC family P-type ATPase [Patescibacteria group bacterium]
MKSSDNAPALRPRADWGRRAKDIAALAFRNIFIPINAIIFGVVILLVIFGDSQEGLFLGIIVGVNIVLGFAQDIRAWYTLEELQILTTPAVRRITPGGAEELVPTDAIKKGDRLRVALGDQIPCDSTLLSGTSLEVNEGLITGESDSSAREPGQALLAGSVVTSGGGIIVAETAFAESRIAKMTEGLKRYTANPSPIQRSIARIITYTVYALIAAGAVVVFRGIITGEPELRIVENIGALASVLVPQGLIVIVTLLFTFGAAHFYNRHVLLQEANATEKFGHIKNLCMDKTGTLTENALTVETMVSAPGMNEDEARVLMATYIAASGDSSRAIDAIRTFVEGSTVRPTTNALSFSSWRQYGGVLLGDGTAILSGASETFLPHLSADERTWLNALVTKESRAGRHLLTTVRTTKTVDAVPRELSVPVTLVAVFILENPLREGIQDAVHFFQSRGVTIRILTGDNPETARVVAAAAGVIGSDRIVTGDEMEAWSAADYAEYAERYVIFARIKPEQKERIVDALKQNGFTAMVGDGANDALAVKKANLGIAMADGSAAVRRIAPVILTQNSFAELPGGVRLADSMIENIEIFTSIFMNQTFVAFFLFVVLTLCNFDFPLAPLNISLINYFAVGLPGMLISYWAIRPMRETPPVGTTPFLRRTLPLPLALSVLEAAVGVLIFLIATSVSVPPAPLLIIAFVILGFFYFAVTPKVYSGTTVPAQRNALILLGMLEAALLYAAFQVPFVRAFFTIVPPAGPEVGNTLFISLGASILMVAFALIFFPRRRIPSRAA